MSRHANLSSVWPLCVNIPSHLPEFLTIGLNRFLNFGGSFIQYSPASQKKKIFFKETYFFLFIFILEKKNNPYSFHSDDPLLPVFIHLFFKKSIYWFVSHLLFLWTHVTYSFKGSFCLFSSCFPPPLPRPLLTSVFSVSMSLFVFLWFHIEERSYSVCLPLSYFTGHNGQGHSVSAC